MRRVIALIVSTLLFAASSAQAETSAERAKRNYELVLRGQKQLRDLSPAERAEIGRLDQLLRARSHDTRPAVQRCREEEIKRAGGSPSDLELRVIGLKCSQL